MEIVAVYIFNTGLPMSGMNPVESVSQTQTGQ